MQLTTERLILRPWAETDAGDLYRYAKDDRVGPIAGWPPHSSVDSSAEIIRTVFSALETYAVCLKEDSRAIGSIGLMIGARSDKEIPDTEGEIGYCELMGDIRTEQITCLTRDDWPSQG